MFIYIPHRLTRKCDFTGRKIGKEERKYGSPSSNKNSHSHYKHSQSRVNIELPIGNLVLFFKFEQIP